MQHAQPLQRSFPWRIAALAALAIAVAELVGLLAVAGVHLLPSLHHAGATSPHRTRPATVARQVPKGPATPLRSRSRVSVLVLNGNGISGAAGDAATQLLHRGYRSATATDAPTHDYAASLVLYRPGWQREARRLAHDAGARIVSPLDGRLPGGSGHDQLVLILGN